MTIIIAALCVWNEEYFIRQCIENIISKLQGISIIEILDGAWLPFSECYPLSTDKTEEIIIELKEKYKHLCKIVLRKPAMVFESESQKRNRQLEIIEKEYKDYTVFVMDADELIHSATGQQIFNLEYYLQNKPDIGCVKAYALGSNQHGWTPRLFRGGKKIHYHTNRTMEVHAKDCNPKIPYDVESQKSWGVKPGMFEITDFVLVNQYVKRDISRRYDKLESRKYESSLPVSACSYK